MATIWNFLVDWDNNDNFTGPHDDVTAYVASADWMLGMQQAYEETGNNPKLTLILVNSDRRFSPDYAGGPLGATVRPFRKVRIQSFDGTTTHTHWTGWIERIAPDVSRYGQRRVTITAAGPMQFLKSTEADIDVQYDKRTDEVIRTLLCVPWINPSGDPDEPLLAVPPVGYITETDPSLKYTTMEISADNWFSAATDKDYKFNLYRAIADAVAAERGRFFFDRDGSAVFWSRKRLQEDMAPSVTLDDTMVDMQYVFTNDEITFRNDIRVTCHPRTSGDTDTTLLWKLEKPIEIEPNTTKRFKVKYRLKDSGEARVGADNVTIADAVFSKGNATITVASRGDTGKIKIVNSGQVTAVLTMLKLRGRTITDFGQEEVKAENLDSITEYGRHTLNMSLSSVEKREYAQMVADYELMRRGMPKGRASQVTLRSHAKNGGGTHDNQLSKTIGDVVALTETQTGLSNKRYVIVGEAHKLSDAATLLETTWYLEPIDDTNTGWRVEMPGRSTLDSATRLYF
jgi:hypothetical protein